MDKYLLEIREIVVDVIWGGRQYIIGIPTAIAEKLNTSKGDKIKFTIVDDSVKIEYVSRSENRDETNLTKSEFAVLQFLRSRKGETFSINEIRLWLQMSPDSVKDALLELRKIGYVTAYEKNKRIMWGLVLEEMSDFESKHTN